MPNLYGVANSPGTWNSVFLIGGADIALTSGAETNVFDSGVTIAPSQGWFYPVAYIMLSLTQGATAPTGITFGLRVNNGADQSQFGINALLYVANNTALWPITLMGTPSQTLYAGAGAHIQIGVTVAGTGNIARTGGSECIFVLFRAADQ